MEVSGATGSFTVSVLAEVGFKATVYLSVMAPTLPLAQVTLVPSTINSPYTDVATVTLTLTGPKSGGTHNIIIKGMNGPTATSYDTVVVTIPNRSPWRVFTADTIGNIRSPWQFVLDKKNGIGWVAGSDLLRSYDGTSWTTYMWPTSVRQRRAALHGMTIDSSGTLWGVFDNMIVKKSGSNWTVIDTADASTGLTRDMLSSLTRFSGEIYSCIHTSPDGTVWILGRWPVPGSSGMETPWLLKYSNSTWTMYNRTNSQVPATFENDVEIITDANSNVWLWSFDHGLTKFDGTYWTMYNNLAYSYQLMMPFAADRNGWVWLRGPAWTGQFNGDSITYYLSDEIQLPDETGNTPNWIYPSYIGQSAQALDIPPNGEVWVGMKENKSDARYPGGVARMVDTTWYHYTIENSGLPDNRVVYLSVDDAGNPWILTEDGSLTILDGSAPPGSVFNEPTASVAPVTGNESYSGAGHLSIMPNPASSQATLRLHLPATDHFRVRLVDGLGRQVALLLDEVRSAGEYGINVPVNGLTAGTYFVQVTGGGISESCPLIVAE
jgi:hypothetical protein